ncbi:hypothetical protein D3C73_1093900 [compost metagenome]
MVCFTGSSLSSTAICVFTVYLPFAAVQVPKVTGAVVEPLAIVPLYEPVSVLTTVFVAVSVTVRVMLWTPPAEAAVPWFLIATVKVTVLPPAGLPGDQLTGAAIRSELETGTTVREAGFV